MNILWSSFTPWSSLAGGVLIGLAAALMIALLGRVTGISGIFGSLLQADTWRQWSQWGWRAAFVLGLILAPLLYRLAPQSPRKTLRLVSLRWPAHPPRGPPALSR